MEKHGETRAKLNHYVRVDEVPRDLLCKLMNRGLVSNGSESIEEEDEEIELSLGLSLNGRFGVDPMRKKLRRSSSISNIVFTVGSESDNGTRHQALGVSRESYEPSLMRACSLPTETAEEVRRRKEVQWMRRMEARKKTMEKSKNVRVVKDKNVLESDNVNGVNELVDEIVDLRRADNENGNGFQRGNGLMFASPQGSNGSLASGSSEISETQSQHIDGVQQNAEARGPYSIQSVPVVQTEQKPAVKAVLKDANGAKEILKNAMLDMPYVSTKGDGKNSNKIDGFLYRYKKGEEVSIICMCHGYFLSPAEFVKHGGGGDVENPLKHIVVNPSPLL